MQTPVTGRMPAIHAMNNKEINILLIEDDADDRFLIEEMLADSDLGPIRIKLESAEDLQSGVQRLKRGGIDLILLDLSLPDSRGLETLTNLLAEESQIPIIVMTALNDEALAVEAV